MAGRTGGFGLRVVVAVSALIAVAGLASAPADARAQRVPTPSTTKVQLTQDVAYGRSPEQRLDVYWTKEVAHAPVILMVHGGGWYRGDKAASGVVTNKVNHWVPEGYVFVSTNYRLVPHVDPIQEVQDVGRALAYLQRHVARWGGDPRQIVLMGHSAGAHLVSLLAAEPELAYDEGARPWLGTVALDSAAYDVPMIMRRPHPKLYDRAFGRDPAFWRAASPTLQVTGTPAPLLLVCSTRRQDSCAQADGFKARAEAAGALVRKLPLDLRHGEIDSQLGLPSRYTRLVSKFIDARLPSLAAVDVAECCGACGVDEPLVAQG